MLNCNGMGLRLVGGLMNSNVLRTEMSNQTLFARKNRELRFVNQSK